jgi:hypothetical protein
VSCTLQKREYQEFEKTKKEKVESDEEANLERMN